MRETAWKHVLGEHQHALQFLQFGLVPWKVRRGHTSLFLLDTRDVDEDATSLRAQ